MLITSRVLVASQTAAHTTCQSLSPVWRLTTGVGGKKKGGKKAQPTLDVYKAYARCLQTRWGCRTTYCQWAHL